MAPFVEEQAASLENAGIEICFYKVIGKGIGGYLSNLRPLKNAIGSCRPDIVHAHYGLCGLLANLQRRVPVITTYHGSDVNNRRIRWLSRISMCLSAYNIFVSAKIRDRCKWIRKAGAVIPSGVDTELFKPLASPVDKSRQPYKRVLFAGAFDNAVKNASAAIRAVNRLEGVLLIELKGYTRAEVVQLLNTSDVLLVTSLSEGSPLVVKEALACNCPVVSVDVGDVKDLIGNIEGCFICSYDPADIAGKITLALNHGRLLEGRNTIISKGLDIKVVAEKLKSAYMHLAH